MRSWINEMYNEYCVPKPDVNFKIIDTNKEQVPVDEDNSIDIHVFFVT